MSKLEYSDCVVCGKPTFMTVTYQASNPVPCHDSCVEGLIKLYPDWFKRKEP